MSAEQGEPSATAARPSDPREPWPRDFGRDGVSGLVTLDRAMRARDVSRPHSEEEAAAAEVLADLLARVDGRRSSGRPRRS
jgi:hypothetical protein